MHTSKPMSTIWRGALTIACTSAVLALAAPEPIQVLYIGGGCCHDYATQGRLIREGMQARAHVNVDVVVEENTGRTSKLAVYDDPEWWKGYDVVIHDECTRKVTDLSFIEGILQPHKDGLPGVVLHCGFHGYGGGSITEWTDFTGYPSRYHFSSSLVGKRYAVSYTHDNHPITVSLSNWTTPDDELYNQERTPPSTMTPLATGTGKGTTVPVSFVNMYLGKTRVFGITLGHDAATTERTEYLDLLTRGLLWTCDKLDNTYLKQYDPNLPDGATCIGGHRLATGAGHERQAPNTQPVLHTLTGRTVGERRSSELRATPSGVYISGSSRSTHRVFVSTGTGR